MSLSEEIKAYNNSLNEPGVFTPANNISNSTVTVKQDGNRVVVSGTIYTNATIELGATLGTISGVDLDEDGYGFICSTSASTVRCLTKAKGSGTVVVSGGLAKGTTQVVNMVYVKGGK
jgi:hypothetical protein